jgi:uncharacterized protein (TIGR02466 family)
MTIKTNVISSFHEPFFIAELDLDNKKILKYLDKIDFIPTGQSEIGKGNSLISKKLNILNDIPNLKKQINSCLKAFIEHELSYDFNFKLLNSWATKAFKNGFSHKHYHSHSFISGVYYPMGNPGFNIEFTKKYINKFWNMPVKTSNVYNVESLKINAGNNMLILFLSDLDHTMLRNTSDEIRYSISFNCVPIGKFDLVDSGITIS